MIFNIEVTDSELFDIMKNGSTNQKIFVEKILKCGAFEEVFDLLEQLQQEGLISDIRGEINGGGLFLTDEISEISENDFLIYHVKNDLYLCL